MVTINITKNHLAYFIGVVLIVASFLMAIAAVPNPGHKLSEVGDCGAGKNVLCDADNDGIIDNAKTSKNGIMNIAKTGWCNANKDFSDCKFIGQNKNCTAFISQFYPERKTQGVLETGCLYVASTGYIQARLRQDESGSWDGWVDCGYICTG
ncbi:MAG: hypothetical protein AABX65_03990 [Nanoarchaeota archaeon]